MPTPREKIRLAKTSFVDARWDKADALREEIHDWKERRRNAELHYLAGAVQLNQDTRNEDLIEEARQTIQSEKGEGERATAQACGAQGAQPLPEAALP